MHTYRIFGGVLHSSVELPELPRSSGPAFWHLETVPELPEPVERRVLGSEPLLPGLEVILVEHEEGLRLEYDDTGTFDVSLDGRRIEWAPPRGGVELAEVRKDILGRVFSLCLHQAGLLPLHGGAALIGDRAVGVIAPKGHGKSTTIAALVGAGARLLSDDVLAIEVGPPCALRPGVPVAQLRPDSARRVTAESGPEAPDASVRKVRVRLLDTEAPLPDRVPVGALYLLTPVRPGDAGGPSRERVPPTVAAVTLAAQTKMAGLLGVGARAVQLERASVVAEEVPVYRLDVPRDLDRLPELVDRLMTWHDADTDAEGSGG